uniref:Uncharacterized protein n=1 Tax=Cannabis sativa TaxID=3483 RepID=A0A803Q178_CANSA
MQSSGSETASPTTQRLQSLSIADTRGRHRIQAELKRLEQETRFLEGLGPRGDTEADNLCYCFLFLTCYGSALSHILSLLRTNLAWKSLNSLKEWKEPQPLATKHMALLVHYGIDGLKDLKIQKVADAGSCDDFR